MRRAARAATSRWSPQPACAWWGWTNRPACSRRHERGRSRSVSSRLASRRRLDEPPYFDAVLTIDALENIPPEDWPVVLANLRNALKPTARCT